MAHYFSSVENRDVWKTLSVESWDYMGLDNRIIYFGSDHF